MRTLRLALRQLLFTPGFTAVVVLTLALGIGLNTAMFSVLNTLLLRPMPYPNPDRLFHLDRTIGQQPDDGHAPPDYYDIGRQSTAIAQIAAYRDWGFTVSEPGHAAEFGSSMRVSADFLDVLGIQPALGRGFRADEDAPGRNHVIILNHPFWQSRFNGDEHVIGRVVRVDGEPAEIIGVLPAVPGNWGLVSQERFLRPFGLTEDERMSRSDKGMQIVGRFRPGVTRDAAQAHFGVVAGRLAADHLRENGGLGLRMVSLQDKLVGPAAVTLSFLLVGLSPFVLLIACANLANLLVARAVSRVREFAIRSALGASASQLVRPLAVECLLIATAGGALGIQLSIWTTQWLGARLTSGEGPPVGFVIDWRVLIFALGTALATALVFGVAPALLVSRVRVSETLKSGTRGSSAGSSHRRFRHALIVGQFAMALILLAGAAGFVRGLDRLITREAGWNPAPLVSGRVSLPAAASKDPDRMLRFYQQLRDRLATLPGAANATIALDLPLYGFSGPRGYLIEGRDRPRPGQEPTAYANAVTPDYFDTVGTPIVRGRGILPGDTRESPPVVVINETMARILFPKGDAIGHRLEAAGDSKAEWAEIVGVARDVRFISVKALPTVFQVYKPLSQETWGSVSVTVRAKDAASAPGLVEPIRRTIAEFDRDLPVVNLMPVPAYILRTNEDLASVNELLVGFAALGLLLAAVGIYGVIARLVSQRTIEIGIRMALGAGLGQVVWLVLRSGVRMAGIGTGLGLLGGVALVRVLASSLPELVSVDAWMIAVAAILLVVVALFACYLPARRAMKVDPLIAMRAE
jgi:putative ABC transport system permease protein